MNGETKVGHHAAWPGFVFVLGASASGKTTAVEELAARALPRVSCHHFDSIGVPSAEEMEREHGGGEQWQAAVTRQWIERLSQDPDHAEVYVLEGQTRPSFVRRALDAVGVTRAEMVLLDCSPEVRRARLAGGRGQPELATEQMDAWAAYLRGQADALGLTVIDTGALDVRAVVDQLADIVDMVSASRAAE